MDAHDPNEMDDGTYEIAQAIAKKYQLSVVSKMPLKQRHFFLAFYIKYDIIIQNTLKFKIYYKEKFYDK